MSGGCCSPLGPGTSTAFRIQDNGTPLPEEPALNVINGDLADDPGVATDLTLYYQFIANSDGPFPQRKELLFSDRFILGDDPGNDATTVDVDAELPSVGVPDAQDVLAVNPAGTWAKAANAFLNFATVALRTAYVGLKTAGMLSYVSTTQCLYILAPDLTTWDFYAPSPELAKQASWFVTTTGSDSNDGLTLGTALLTTGELQQRLCPGGQWVRLAQAVTITLGAGTFNDLLLNVESLISTGVNLVTIVGNVTSTANITLSASVAEVPLSQISAQVTTLAGTFVNRARIRATSGTRNGSITYSTGLVAASVLNTFVGPWINYNTSSQLPPAAADTVVVDTLNTVVKNVAINVKGLAGCFYLVQDLQITQSCTLDDYTNTVGANTGSSSFIFGCELATGCDLFSNAGGTILGSRVLPAAGVRIRSGNWVLSSCSIQGNLYTYPNVSLDADVFVNAIDGGNIILGGTSASHRIGPSSMRNASALQLCNGTASSAVSLGQGSNMQTGSPIWSRTGATAYTNAVQVDPNSTFQSSVAFTSIIPAATNVFLVGGVGYPAQQVLCPQLGSFVVSAPLQPMNASLYLTAQAANIGATNLFAANPRKGNYVFTAYGAVTVAGTAGVLTLNAIFTDDSGVARTVAVATSASIVAAGGQGGIITLEVAAGTMVQYSVTGIVTPGALQYSLRVDCRLRSDG